jgi:hypothetical protein
LQRHLAGDICQAAINADGILGFADINPFFALLTGK